MKPENERGTGNLRFDASGRSARGGGVLEGDKTRILTEMKILENSRVRLESAVGTADAEVDLLRRRLELRRAQESTSLEPEARPDNRPKPQ